MCCPAGKYTIQGEKSTAGLFCGKSPPGTLANGRALCYNG